jgi:hypothetical protein
MKETKVYFAQEKSRKYEELSFSFRYKRCVIRIFTFIHISHKRLNRIKCILRNRDKFGFTLDIWESEGPVDLGKEIKVTSDLIKFLVSVSSTEHGFCTPEHAKLIEEWKQKNTMTT